MPDWDEDSPNLRKNLQAVLLGIRDAAVKREPLTPKVIKQWHREIMRGLAVPDPSWVGRFRGEAGLETVEVGVGTKQGSPAPNVAGEIATFSSQLARLLWRLDQAIPPDAGLTSDHLEAVLEVCAWAHSEWVRIHPFANGNGRTARLLANGIALRYGLPPFVRLRPRPNHGYNRAAEASMRGDHRPLAQAFHRMLDACLNGH